MRILSIYPGHNSSVCILDDGRVVLNWELERFSRIKHDYGYCERFLVHSLRCARLAIQDIDLLCVNRGLIDSSPVRCGTVLRPFDVPSTTEREVEPFSATLLGKRFEALAINHHLAHAACAFFTSPFHESAIFTYDGYGDAENASFALGRGNTILEFTRRCLDDLGGWWVSLPFNNYRMPRVHEWDPGSHAGKLMALAAYGVHDEDVAQRLDSDMRRAQRCPHYPDPAAYAFNDAEDLSDTRTARAQNLSHALQQRTEAAIVLQFDALHRMYPVPRVCYAGGLALNCIANSRALAASPFDDLHVPPCPNDSGLALGMALYAHHQHCGAPRPPGFLSPYTGPAYDDAASVIAGLAERDGLKHDPLAIERLVDVLCRRELVCFFTGRAECGPRALGNRSIMCLPDRDGGRDFLNFSVKRREWYRPYGPIILAEAAADVLENCPGNAAYMTRAARVRSRWRQRLAAVNHVDDTTRPQILERSHHPMLHDVLSEVYRRTGIPALLNTSFNLQEPIVETPLDAWKTFTALPVRYLATDAALVEKPRTVLPRGRPPSAG